MKQCALKILKKLKENSDLVQAVCSIISVASIGLFGLLISNRANEISEKQFYFSTQPYFTISEVGNGGLENFQIYNDGGYIQNASLELSNFLKIDIYEEEDFIKTIYIPFGVNSKELYDVKDKTFTIKSPNYLMEAAEVENRIYSYYMDTKYSFIVSRFQYITFVYLDYNHNYKQEKYLIYKNTESQEYSLAPMNEELMQTITDSTPEEYKDESSFFPDGTIWSVVSDSGRGATRTFSDDAQHAADKVIEKINQLIN